MTLVFASKFIHASFEDNLVGFPLFTRELYVDLCAQFFHPQPKALMKMSGSELEWLKFIAPRPTCQIRPLTKGDERAIAYHNAE